MIGKERQVEGERSELTRLLNDPKLSKKWDLDRLREDLNRFETEEEKEGLNCKKKEKGIELSKLTSSVSEK